MLSIHNAYRNFLYPNPQLHVITYFVELKITNFKKKCREYCAVRKTFFRISCLISILSPFVVRNRLTDFPLTLPLNIHRWLTSRISFTALTLTDAGPMGHLLQQSAPLAIVAVLTTYHCLPERPCNTTIPSNLSAYRVIRFCVSLFLCIRLLLHCTAVCGFHLAGLSYSSRDG